MADTTKGIPSFALPWVELGRLEEREKWQALAINLMESSVCSELQDLKRSIADALPRLPELKQNIGTKLDASQTKISSLISEYRKLFLTESATQPLREEQKKITVQALQYQPCYGCYEIIREKVSDSTEIVTEEMSNN